MKITKFLKIGVTAILASGLLSACHRDNPVPEGTGPIQLQIIGDNQLFLAYEQTKELNVLAIFSEDESPAANRKVSFEFSGDKKDSRLDQTVVTTDDSGIATVTLTTGRDKAKFDIIASSSSANMVQFNIDVDAADKGTLTVYPALPAANSDIPLSQIVTRIYKRAFNCDHFADYSQYWDDNYEAEETSGNISLPVSFSGLPEGEKYTVAVIAKGREDNVIARGCALTKEIEGRKSIETTVHLELMPLTLTGTYQMASELNLLDMIPGDKSGFSAANIVDHIIRFFENPGNYLISWGADNLSGGWLIAFNVAQTAAVTAFEQYFCPTHDGIPEDGNSDTVTAYWDYNPSVGTVGTRYSCWCVNNNCSTTGMCGIEGDQTACKNTQKPGELDQYLNMMISFYAPSWVSDIFKVGKDIANMVQHLTVGGEFDIDEATPESEGSDIINIKGTERWNQYMFVWTLGQNCSVDNACCGRHVFGAGNASNNQLNAASGSFTGKAQVSSQNFAYKLQIDQHSLSLDYGNIIMYLLKNLAFPALAKMEAPVSFSDVLNAVVPVKTISCWTSGSNRDSCNEQCVINITKNPDGTRSWKANGQCPTITNLLIDVLGKLGDYIDGQMAGLSVSGSDKYRFTIRSDNNAYEENLLSDTFPYDLQADSLYIKLKGEIYAGDENNDWTDMTGSMTAKFAKIIRTDPYSNDRFSCTSDSECIVALGNNRTCQVFQGLVNTCDERMVCAPNVGTYVGEEACATNSDCQSGFCMENSNGTRTCFAACTSDANCKSSSTCKNDITFDFAGTGYNAQVSGCVAR